MAGSALGNQPQTGSLGIVAPDNTPGGTAAAAYWLEKKSQDSGGNLTEEEFKVFGGNPRLNSATWSFYPEILMWNWTSDKNYNVVYGTKVLDFSLFLLAVHVSCAIG